MLVPYNNRTYQTRALGLVSPAIDRAILILLIRFLFGSPKYNGAFNIHAINKRGAS